MPVNIGSIESGPGWGCSCRGFRWDQPTPEQALAALARSASVTVEFVGADGDKLQFIAWTEPENRYNVTYDPNHAGGWDKHVLACLTHLVPWHRQLALGAADALDRIHELEKNNRKLQRKIARLEAK